MPISFRARDSTALAVGGSPSSSQMAVLPLPLFERKPLYVDSTGARDPRRWPTPPICGTVAIILPLVAMRWTAAVGRRDDSFPIYCGPAEATPSATRFLRSRPRVDFQSSRKPSPGTPCGQRPRGDICSRRSREGRKQSILTQLSPLTFNAKYKVTSRKEKHQPSLWLFHWRPNNCEWDSKNPNRKNASDEWNH